MYNNNKKIFYIEDDIMARKQINEIDKKRLLFDYYWKIGLIIILLFSIIFVFYEWIKLNKEALMCVNSPFDWGQKKAEEQGFYCYYSCFKEGIEKINNINNTFDIPK